MNKKIMSTFKTYKDEYYHWRFWDNLIREMKNKTVITKRNNSEKLEPYINKPGIAFSFDDSFRVDGWYTYAKDLLNSYNIKATFNINAFHHFENQRELIQKEVDMLLELQSEGHEIAHHGLKHRKATDYSAEFGLNGWLEDEINSLFKWMDKYSHSETGEKFKKPVSFAFPNFVYNEDLIKEVVPQYFKIVRGHLSKNNLTPFNHTGFAPSICIDSNRLSHIKYIKKAMKIAKQSGENLILTCHSVLPEDKQWQDYGWGDEAEIAGKWRITPETINRIIEEAQKLDLEFYKTSELAGIATFADSNLEKCIRNELSIPNDQWVRISEVCLIKELDLSYKNIHSLDGIQYLLNIEKLNIKNNYITDLRLLEKLPKIKDINFSNNPTLKDSIKIV